MRPRILAVILTLSTLLTGCGLFSQQTELLRSDMPLMGLDTSTVYRLESTPDGKSEVNEITTTGIGDTSPMPSIKTSFTKTSDTVRQQLSQVYPTGQPINALGMTQVKINFGLTEWLAVSVSTEDFRDAKGSRACGAKVRMDFKPSIESRHSLSGEIARGWDAIWYYLVPCDKAQGAPLDIANAKFHALVINEQWVPRITGKPLFFNRGRSITVVGGQPSRLAPGWWQVNAKPDSNASILGADEMLKAMVADLNSFPDDRRSWMTFSYDGPFRDSHIVYSAGDADVFWSINRLFLNRQVDYVVNYRSTASGVWRRLIVRPIYNFEWNDFSQHFQAFKGFNPLNVDERLDQYGIPKDINDPIIKEIEQQGWQNAPNATLEQIQIIDGASNAPVYAMTVRGYVGAKNSLVMFGQLPGDGFLQDQQRQADERRQRTGLRECPVNYDELGKRLEQGKQWSPERCAELLREGAMWSYLTENPDKFGFDLVGQFNVRDNGTWASRCSGSGESTYCFLEPVERKLDAIYMFNQDSTTIPWTIMQMLGEVGVRTLGMSYASDAYAGTGMIFAMAQSVVREQYTNGISNPEMVFALDARAMQLPLTIQQADNYLK